VGGGAEILMSADTIFAARSARVGFVHASLGVSPGWGGGGRLIQRVGARTALRVLVEARRLLAPEALALGLIDQVCEGSALEAARKWLRELSAIPTAATRAAVSLVRSADPDQERREFLSLWGADAHRDALEKMRSRS
jgi:enoyl-CoA hydratase/carnithine racemase